MHYVHEMAFEQKLLHLRQQSAEQKNSVLLCIIVRSVSSLTLGWMQKIHSLRESQSSTTIKISMAGNMSVLCPPEKPKP